MGKSFSLKSSSNDPSPAPFLKIAPLGAFLLGMIRTFTGSNLTLFTL